MIVFDEQAKKNWKCEMRSSLNNTFRKLLNEQQQEFLYAFEKRSQQSKHRGNRWRAPTKPRMVGEVHERTRRMLKPKKKLNETQNRKTQRAEKAQNRTNIRTTHERV